MPHQEPADQVGRTLYCKRSACVYAFLIHAWVYLMLFFSFCSLCFCMFVPVFASLQAGHDSRPTAPEQPSQGLFLPLPVCLLQPGEEELHPGVRIPPTYSIYPPTLSFTCHMGSVHSSVAQFRSWFVLRNVKENIKCGLIYQPFVSPAYLTAPSWRSDGNEVYKTCTRDN